jgi:conjugative transposon TraK protein
MFKSLNNIQGAFSLSKFYIIGISVVCAVICAFSIWKSYQFAEEQRQKIYVLDQGKSLMLALQQDVAQARPAEAKAHIRRFHELFFTNSPSKQQIDYNISEALNLADNSAVVYYNKRKNDHYYEDIAGSGIICEIKVDSIKVDMINYPYSAVTYATTSETRLNDIRFFSMITTCKLFNCARSDNNPHGFLIEDFQVTQIKPLQTITK